MQKFAGVRILRAELTANEVTPVTSLYHILFVTKTFHQDVEHSCGVLKSPSTLWGQSDQQKSGRLGQTT